MFMNSTTFFSIYIKLKDKIIFDHLLEANEIYYSHDFSFETFGEQIFRYSISNNKKNLINQICIEEGIEWLEP